jgi:hypothetical protein
MHSNISIAMPYLIEGIPSAIVRIINGDPKIVVHPTPRTLRGVTYSVVACVYDPADDDCDDCDDCDGARLDALRARFPGRQVLDSSAAD